MRVDNIAEIILFGVFWFHVRHKFDIQGYFNYNDYDNYTKSRVQRYRWVGK